MFAKIVLCVTNHRLLAGLWRFGRLVSHQAFENNPQGLDGFSRYLHRHQGIRLYLLVDAIEEDYRLETLPHTMGRARHEIVTRKLNQLYRSTPYRTAHFIGREDGKRRDDRFVFAALNSADFLQGWVDQTWDLFAELVAANRPISKQAVLVLEGDHADEVWLQTVDNLTDLDAENNLWVMLGREMQISVPTGSAQLIVRGDGKRVLRWTDGGTDYEVELGAV